MLAEMGMFIFLIAMSFLLFIVVASILNTRKSKQYREVLSDMYVASKIKQLAKKDDLDLNAEFESFKKWEKKHRLSDEKLSLDNAVEEDLKSQLAENISPIKVKGE